MNIDNFKEAVNDAAMIGDQPYPSFEARIYIRYLRLWLSEQTIESMLSGIELSFKEIDSDFIPAHKMLSLIEKTAQVLPAPGSACRIGFSFLLEDFGEVGDALMSSSTLLEAFQMQNRYSQLFGSFTDVHVDVDTEYLTVNYINVNRIPAATMQFNMEVGLGSLLSVASQLIGESVKMKSVKFTAEASPQIEALYESILNCPVTFGADHNGWQIELPILAVPVRTDSKLGVQSADHLCEQLLLQANENKGLTNEIVEMLSTSEGDYPDLELIASALHMSSRTLRRKLSDLNTNYQSLLNQVRCRLAIVKLASGARSAEDIADELGYADVANFRNAFKRWMGMTPGQIAKIFD